ncbi:hypothetical protein [Sorangium cellulosum]|uniref:Secreted protein n=1 Tax=Sorangium cellulosum TaxID=56 RepID=A0A150QDV8_SORCE|nr:hypothetical protein [Sorangium cellulosum]KYF65896.1 hypothetical protein BE15_23415 [Sorangium cellulosum]
MKSRSLFSAKAALLVLCVSIPEAAAQDRTSTKDDNYSYTFVDDLLDASNRDAGGAVLQVRQPGRRDRLLRPRLHFVPEMLKSVESM